MASEQVDKLIVAAFRVGTAPLADLRAAAEHARSSARGMRIDTSDDDHMNADLSAMASLAISAEMLDLLVTYRQVQSWPANTVIDINDHQDTTNGD